MAAADLHKTSSQSFSLYKKRPALRVKVKRSANPNATALLAGYQFDHSDAHVKEVARELVKNIPTYESEIQVSLDFFFCEEYASRTFLHARVVEDGCSHWSYLLFR